MSSIAPASPDEQTDRPRKSRRLSGCLYSSLAFLLGILVGVGGLLLFVLFVPETPITAPPPTQPTNTAIIVQVSPLYIAQASERNMGSAGLGGKVKNIQVTLAKDSPVLMTGDYEFSLLGFPVTRHFKLQIQPVIVSCQIQARVVHAELGGIPVTNFVRVFESQINQELQVSPNNLPKGFTYCISAVRTEPAAVVVTYSATPQ